MVEFIETIIKGLSYAVEEPWIIVVVALVLLVITLGYNRAMK